MRYILHMQYTDEELLLVSRHETLTEAQMVLDEAKQEETFQWGSIRDMWSGFLIEQVH